MHLGENTMEVHPHKTDRTFGMKLRRFFRRLMNGIRRIVDEACDYIVGSPTAVEMPYLGFTEVNE